MHSKLHAHTKPLVGKPKKKKKGIETQKKIGGGTITIKVRGTCSSIEGEKKKVKQESG